MTMSSVLTESIRVRGNEVDATAEVPLAMIVRYGESIRWGLGSWGQDGAPDGVLAGRFQGGIARAQSVRYVTPAKHPDELRLETHIVRVGHTSFDVAHHITRESDGAHIADTRITIVHVGPNGKTPLDPSLRELVVPFDAPTHPSEFTPPPDDAFVRRWVIRHSDQDRFDHVNQARYFEAVSDTLRLAALGEHPAGAMPTQLGASVSYEREVHAGEEVEMRLWSIGSNERALELRVAGEDKPAARMRVTLR